MNRKSFTSLVGLFLLAGSVAAHAQTNDSFSGRTALTGLTPVFTGSTVNATKETSEPNHVGFAGGKSIWLTWTAPADSTVTVDTNGSNFDTLLAVYSGNAVTSLTVLASDDDSGGNATSRVTFTARASATYAIAVDGYGGSSGGVTLHLTAVPIVAPNAAPEITSQPVGVTAIAGGTVIFRTKATGSPIPTFSWFKDGTTLISGATGASLTLTNVQPGDAGRYSALASNAVGAATTLGAVLTVEVPTAKPVFTINPSTLIVSANSTAFLTSLATGAATYQWRKDGVALPGETEPNLVVRRAAADQAGIYSVVATNSLGSVTSSSAIVAISTTSDFGRIVNLSILTDITFDDAIFKLGTVLGGSGTSGSKPLVIRAVGPSLTPFGVSNALADPKLSLTPAGSPAGTPPTASNDNWAGDSTLSIAMARVGAFAFTNNFTRDAAIAPVLPAGGYVVDVSGVAGSVGSVLAEIYDATESFAFTRTTPRLINVSVLKLLPADGLLTAGFVISGVTAKTVLIRAIGPGLVPFGVLGAMGDPQLALYHDGAQIAANDSWGGDPQLVRTQSDVGAFALSDSASRDAVLTATLAPGAYAAQVRGVGRSAGTVLVEIYEVP